ncbi:alpha/beta hydrolase [Bdellovibrio sp. 22V]|uniref:alpha/beta fold hydrolase n=1 Tax=Bdellovibrio sp. 22V TaxID=3044166 RepID=UPI002543D5A2|nr:alpha/beta hydrolase [Bdellovibrio sp. 22V]WII71090.1 alpha/beta hydrolase [Bdellovibrio sp. 22V]
MQNSLAQKAWFLTVRYASWVLPETGARWAQNIFLTPTRVPRPESEKAYYESARKYTLVNGMAAYEWGPATGPIIALVHGWNGRGTQIAAFAGPLAEKGYRVIALDGPAHGASLGARTNVGEYARALIDAQKELGPFVAVIAHSFGAGTSVLAKHWGLQADKLILIGGPSRYEKVVGNYLSFIKISPRAEKVFLDLLTKKVGLSPRDLNVGTIGAKVSGPVLIVHDSEDKEVSYKAAIEIHETWPGSQLMTTTGLGHRRILKAPEVIERVTQFILEN